MQIPLAARLAAIVIDCATPAVPPDESVTWTVNVKGPAMVGVPEIELADIASGGGRAPELIDQLYGGRPPEAAKEIVG